MVNTGQTLHVRQGVQSSGSGDQKKTEEDRAKGGLDIGPTHQQTTRCKSEFSVLAALLFRLTVLA